MTEREALKLALEALEGWRKDIPDHWGDIDEKTVDAIKEVLAQPQQEPFGYFRYDLRLDAWVQNRAGITGTPFYTTPPQPEQEPVAWLQFRDNEPPVVAPRDLGTPVFLGIRGGLAHDAGEKP